MYSFLDETCGVVCTAYRLGIQMGVSKKLRAECTQIHSATCILSEGTATYGGGPGLVFALNFNYFLEKLAKICAVVSAILNKLEIKLHETMIYSSVRQLGF